MVNFCSPCIARKFNFVRKANEIYFVEQGPIRHPIRAKRPVTLQLSIKCTLHLSPVLVHLKLLIVSHFGSLPRVISF